MNKTAVHQQLIEVINNKIDQALNALNEATSSVHNETKSSAGDKHETGRAMAQLEQEKLGKQLQAAKSLKEAASRIDSERKSDKVEFGSLVQWNNQWYYFSVGVGQINVEENNIFCLSITSPLGNLMHQKKKGDSVKMNQIEAEIQEIR